MHKLDEISRIQLNKNPKQPGPTHLVNHLFVHGLLLKK